MEGRDIQYIHELVHFLCNMVMGPAQQQELDAAARTDNSRQFEEFGSLNMESLVERL